MLVACLTVGLQDLVLLVDKVLLVSLAALATGALMHSATAALAAPIHRLEL